MPEDISLLPEELRKKEDVMKAAQPAKGEPGSDLKFNFPTEEEEDIEIIEVDEGELDQVLQGEPTLTKAAYYLTAFVEDIRGRLFKTKPEAAPAKTPPEFFKAPPMKAGAALVKQQMPGLPGVPAEAAKAGTGVLPTAQMTGAPKGKVQIAPFAKTPRRVRVIRRVRKPVKVSFVSEEALRLKVDVPRRRFTLITAVVTFLLLLGGTYGLLDYQLNRSKENANQAKRQLESVRSDIQSQLQAWSSFQLLEPKLQTLAALLDQHLSPTTLLEDLEINTLPTVYYTNFALSPDRRISLGITADSLDSAARQLAAYQQAPFVKKVEANSYTVEYDDQNPYKVKAVSFNIWLTLNEGALLKQLAKTSQ